MGYFSLLDSRRRTSNATSKFNYISTRFLPMQRNCADEYSHLTGADACGEIDSAQHSAPLAGSAIERVAPASLSTLERGSQAGRALACTVSEVQLTGMMFPHHSERSQSIKLRERPLELKTMNCHNIIITGEFAR